MRLGVYHSENTIEYNYHGKKYLMSDTIKSFYELNYENALPYYFKSLALSMAKREGYE